MLAFPGVWTDSPVQFNSIYSHFYKIFTIYIVRLEYTNKEKKKKKKKRKLMAWIEVYGGQRNLAFELTTAMLWVEIHK